MNLFTQLRPDWHATPPERLLDAPVTALKAVDETRAEALQAALGVHTVGEMATQPLADWVWQAYSRFRAGAQRELPADAAEHVADSWCDRSCGEWLASPLDSLKELSAEAVESLGDTMGWVTVRHLATDLTLAAAREIHRVATGAPQTLDEAPAPLPDYFSGGTQRFLNKAREQAGLPVRPPAPPPAPPAPPKAPAAPPPPDVPAAAPVLPTEGELAPAVAANLHPGAGSRMPAPPPWEHKDYTPDGSYIPRGGGSRGWMDNTGVARNERPNSYRYHEVVDTRRFRHASLEAAVHSENRGSDRKDVRLQVRWSADPGVPPMPGVCLNISLTGALVRVGQELRRGAHVQVTWVHRDELLGDEQALLTLAAEVVWARPVNATFRKGRFDCGLHFDALGIEDEEHVVLLMTEQYDKLVPQQAE